MKIMQILQKRGGVSRLLSKKVKLTLLISTLALLTLSYLSTSCSESIAKSAQEETTTTTATSTTIDAYATTTTTTMPSYEVTFNSQGGSDVSSQNVYGGDTVTKPTSPTKSGCTFNGWYKETGFTTPWIFDTDTVTNNVVLYAKFTDALWAKSVTAGTDESCFNSVAVDSSGNVYAAGYQKGTESYTYGPGVSVAGTYLGKWESSYLFSGSNVVLVKYDSSGTALWARSVTAGTDESCFNSVAVDSSGNVYAAGRQSGEESYTYGPGVSVAGTGAVLVKYDSTGTALWAKSVMGTNSSYFISVAVDSLGNIYAAGRQFGEESFTYGAGVSVAGTYKTSNVVLVKYDSSGTALWAKSVTAGTDQSCFYSVAVDSSGNIYAAGYQYGTGSFTYGTGVTVAGTNSGYNVVLVKYNSSGTALWAKSVTAGTSSSEFKSVAVDSSGNIYAAGRQSGTGSCTYGTGVSVAGTNLGEWGLSLVSGDNVVIVKYNSSGTALWARSVTAGTKPSYFNSVAVDSFGNVYAAGRQSGTGSYTYGAGVSVAGALPSENVVLVKYDSSRTALWAKSITTGTGSSVFNSVAVDSSGNVYAAGYQYGTESYTYGAGVSVAGTGTYSGYNSGYNVVLVKYDNP